MDFSGIKHIVFDWGDTLMVDLPLQPGPMAKWSKVQAVEGALDTLRTLTERGYRCYIGTNAASSGSEEVFQALARVELDEYIEECYTALDLELRKPDRAFYQFIERDVGAKSGEMLFVGDSFDNDVFGPTQAGWRAVWLQHATGEPRKGAKYTTIRKLAELKKLLISA